MASDDGACKLAPLQLHAVKIDTVTARQARKYHNEQMKQHAITHKQNADILEKLDAVLAAVKGVPSASSPAQLQPLAADDGDSSQSTVDSEDDPAPPKTKDPLMALDLLLAKLRTLNSQ